MSIQAAFSQHTVTITSENILTRPTHLMPRFARHSPQICIFYLCLRALDTIEDDMTIPAERKVSLLLDFYKKLHQPGWNFTESGPHEKDRQLLVDFDKVIAEFQLLSDGYQTVIADITAKMGAGMASYIEASAKSPLSVNTFVDWDLYCHFVAGLVGEGLSRLFAESGMERAWLGDQLFLSNHMGLFLQKVNIIRDYAEDTEEERFFWPKECYSRFGFASQPDVCSGIVETSPGSKQFRPQGEAGARGMAVLSTLLLDAMRHATRALDYLAMLREQSIFNFCAIPQTMAIATIELMVNNPNVLRRNVKIRKTTAVQLIMRSVNPRDVAYLFREYATRIAKKVPVDDVNYVQWHVELGRIHTWCEHFYPAYISVGAGSDGKASPAGSDIRADAMKRYGAARHLLALERASASGLDVAKIGGDTRARSRVGASGAPSGPAVDPRRAYMSEEEIAAQDTKDRDEMIKFFVVIMCAIGGIMGLVALASWYVAWYISSPDETDPLTLFVMRNAKVVREGVGKLVEDVKGDPVGWAGGQVKAIRDRFEL